MALEFTLARDLPVLGIELAVGAVGFGISFVWGKNTGREMDRETVMFLAKMWGGITLFGIVLLFMM